MARNSTTLLATSLVFAAFSTAAFAHAQLQKAMPAVGSTIASPPSEIRLKFSEAVEPRFSGVAVAAQDGGSQSVGPVSVAADDPTTLVAKIEQPLKPGVYKVTWQVVSVDTHRTQGSFVFTLAP
jgi:methionine-rich copper-binding protein CopC